MYLLSKISMAAELDDSNSNNKLGVGIIGCARIAKKNCVAAASNPFASCRITAISSRSEDKARALSMKYSLV